MLCGGVAQGPRGTGSQAPGCAGATLRPREPLGGVRAREALSLHGSFLQSRGSERSRVWRCLTGALQGQVCAPVPSVSPGAGRGDPRARAPRLWGADCGFADGDAGRPGGRAVSERAPARRGTDGARGAAAPGGGLRALPLPPRPRGRGAAEPALGRRCVRGFGAEGEVIPGSLGIKLPGIRLPPGFHPVTDARRCLRFPPAPRPALNREPRRGLRARCGGSPSPSLPRPLSPRPPLPGTVARPSPAPRSPHPREPPAFPHHQAVAAATWLSAGARSRRDPGLARPRPASRRPSARPGGAPGGGREVGGPRAEGPQICACLSAPFAGSSAWSPREFGGERQ